VHLEGSCHCGRVRFRLESAAPYPYQRCYCSICRKTAGGGGYAINLGGDATSLEVEGREHIAIYHARLDDPNRPDESPAERHFCKHCASALWLWSPNWPELIHPFASAIDTPLPEPPERVHILLDSRANWCEIPAGPREQHFEHYPDESLADWHRRHGLTD
jgi:hypothetical protein